MTISYEALIESISRVKQSERVTKYELGLLSRDILSYMLESEDVRPVNVLLGTSEDDSFVLTPVNWRIAAQYFKHFLPFSSNYDEVKANVEKGEGNREPLVFGKKQKRKWDKKSQEIAAFLEDEDNTIWTWSKNVEIKAQPVDYAKKVTQAVKAAANPEKGDMTAAEILAAILEAEGMSMGQIIEAVHAMHEQEQQEAA